MRTEHVEVVAKEVMTSTELDPAALQRSFQEVGAIHVVIEETEEGVRYECRCLMPLSPESSYQKAFSAMGSSPAVAAEQVLAEVRAWQRAVAGDPRFR